MKSELARRARLLMFCAALAMPAWVCAQPSPAPSTSPSAAIDVERFDISGNTLLDPAAIAAVLEPYKGRRTLDQLQHAARELQQLYTKAGWGGVIAYVPPQGAGAGVVRIVVVEGKVATVTVRGAKAFSEEDVRASVPDLQVGATPRLRRIDAQLQIANENPAKRINLLLRPGPQPGQIDAEITATESPLQRLIVSLDNTGNPLTGMNRLGAIWSYANLSGHDDVISAQYQTSPSKPGQVSVLGLGYRRPLYRQLAMIDAYAAYSNVNGGTTTTPGGDLSFSGSGRVAGARLTWLLPRVGDADQRLAVGVDVRQYLNQCRLAGAGNCGGGASTDVAVQPLTLEYDVQANGRLSMGASVVLAHNLHLGGGMSDASRFAAIRPGGAAPAYTELRIGLNGRVDFAGGWQLRGRLASQLTSDALVPGEQFGLGGVNSVRGYLEREIAGDRGVQASVELATPELLDEPAGAGSLRPFAFVDAGRISNVDALPCLGSRTSCTLASWGAGLRWDMRRLAVRLALAHAAKDAQTTRAGDARAHFSIAYTF